MMKRRRHPGIFLLELLCFALLFIQHYSLGLPLTVKNATPFLLIPFMVACAMFCDEWNAMLIGLVIGIFMDAAAANTLCFHSVFMLLLGFSVSRTVHYLFNSNIRSAIALSLISALAYFALRWLLFIAFKETATGNITYLLSFAIPSAVYTCIFIIPFFYFQRFLAKKREN